MKWQGQQKVFALETGSWPCISRMLETGVLCRSWRNKTLGDLRVQEALGGDQIWPKAKERTVSTSAWSIAWPGARDAQRKPSVVICWVNEGRSDYLETTEAKHPLKDVQLGKLQNCAWGAGYSCQAEFWIQTLRVPKKLLGAMFLAGEDWGGQCGEYQVEKTVISWNPSRTSEKNVGHWRPPDRDGGEWGGMNNTKASGWKSASFIACKDLEGMPYAVPMA